MGCGCAERREWIRRKFNQWSNPFADFSIANEAPGKSPEGAWIKSTENARGFSGTAFLQVKMLPHFTGKMTTELWETGDQESFYIGGLYEFHLIKPDTTTWAIYSTLGFIDVDPSTTYVENSGCNIGGVDTPDGFTGTQMLNGASVALDVIDRIDVRLKSDGTTIIRSYTNLNLCRDITSTRKFYDIV